MTKRKTILNRKREIMTLEEGHEAGQWGHHEDKCTSPLIKLFEKRRTWVFISVVSMECLTPKAFYTSVISASEKMIGVASPKTIFCICLTETFLSPSLRTAWENKIILREYIVVNETCIILSVRYAEHSCAIWTDASLREQVARLWQSQELYPWGLIQGCWHPLKTLRFCHGHKKQYL